MKDFSKIFLSSTIAFFSLQNFVFASDNSPKENKLLVSQLVAVINDLKKMTFEEAVGHVPNVNHPEIKYIRDLLNDNSIDDFYDKNSHEGLLQQALKITGKATIEAYFEDQVLKAKQTTTEALNGIELTSHMGPILSPKIEKKILKIKDYLIDEKNFYDNLDPRNLFKKLALLSVLPKIKHMNNNFMSYFNDNMWFDVYSKTRNHFINYKLRISKIPELLERAIDEWCEESFLRIQVRKGGWNQALSKQELARNNHIYALLVKDFRALSKIIKHRLEINDLSYSIIDGQAPNAKQIKEFFTLILAFNHKYRRLLRFISEDQISQLKNELPDYIGPSSKFAELERNPKWSITLNNYIYEPIGFNVEHYGLTRDELRTSQDLPKSPDASPNRRRKFIRDTLSLRDRRSIKLPEKNETPSSSGSPSPSSSQRGRVRYEENTSATDTRPKFHKRSSTEIGGSIEHYRRNSSLSPTRAAPSKIEIEKIALGSIVELKEDTKINAKTPSKSRETLQRKKNNPERTSIKHSSDSNKAIEQAAKESSPKDGAGQSPKTLQPTKRAAIGSVETEANPQGLDLSNIKRDRTHRRQRSRSSNF